MSLYRNDGWVDLCEGPHVPSTGRLGAFRLTSTAGAYWRGVETNPMLTRIYGTAWATQEDLDAHLHRLEEAEKRDHRRLGRELDLFSSPDELGPGLWIWHPRGGIFRKELEDWVRDLHLERGYDLVVTPHIARSVLWETSGHLAKYRENMYPPMEADTGDYYVKPMNCPFHVLVYKSQVRSYRDLPDAALGARARSTGTRRRARCTGCSGSAAAPRTTPTSSARPTSSSTRSSRCST